MKIRLTINDQKNQNLKSISGQALAEYMIIVSFMSVLTVNYLKNFQKMVLKHSKQTTAALQRLDRLDINHSNDDEE